MLFQDASTEAVIRACEACRIEPLLQAVFGSRLAYVGEASGLTHLSASPIRQHVHVGQFPEDGMQPGWALQSDDSTLPLVSEAFDAVVLYHALERARDPHRLLREAERILRPSGFLILVTHNPLSLMGLSGLLQSGRATRARHRLHSSRLKDWMKLLGLKPMSMDYGFYRYPFRSERLMRWTHWLESWGSTSRLPLGGVAVMLARKDVFGMTPLLEERLSSRSRATALLPAQARQFNYPSRPLPGEAGASD